MDMTKRFQIDDDGDITEFENQQWIDCWEYGNGKHWDSLCKKLNELYDENEQLKQFIDDLYKKFEDAHGMSIENTDWF